LRSYVLLEKKVKQEYVYINMLINKLPKKNLIVYLSSLITTS